MGTLTVLIAILAVYLLLQMQQINHAATVMAERYIPVIDLAGRLNNDVSQHRMMEIRHVYATGRAMKEDREKS